MTLKVSEARTRERTRLRDNATHYDNATLDDMRLASIRAIAATIRGVWPDYYNARKTYNLYTDAIDPAPDRAEFYALPADFAALRWIERADGSWHPKLTRLSPSKQEAARFAGPLIGTIDFLNGTSTFPVPLTGAMLSYAMYGDRFRIIPPPQSTTTMQVDLFYVRQPKQFAADDELLDLPTEFEEALVLDTCARVLEIEGDAQAQALAQRAGAELATALKAIAQRAATDNLYTAT